MEIFECNTTSEALKSLMLTSHGKPVSIRSFSKKLGYTSDRGLGMVLNGQRRLSHSMLEKISRAKSLTEREAKYLKLLSLKDKYQTIGQSTQAVDQELKSLKQPQSKNVKINPADSGDLVPWYSFSLIEVLDFYKSPVSVELVRGHLRGQLTLEQIENGLEALAGLYLIKKSGPKLYRMLLTDEYVDTPVDIPSTVIRQMHKAQLQRAMETLEEQSVHEREFIAKTYTISISRLAEMKKRIREVMETLASEFVNNEASDPVVIQNNLQLYQQTHPKTK